MKLFSFIVVVFTLISCTKEKVEKYEPFGVTYPDYFPETVYDLEKNILTKEKFELGRKLFYDEILSSDNTISCGNCHSQTHAFADHNVSFSSGVNNLLGTRNSPAIFNMIWSPAFMWDGGVNHIEIFSLAPITNPLEMNESMSNVIQKLNSNAVYKQLFNEAFGSTEITDLLLFKVLTAFMAKLVSANSKYDAYRKGTATLSADELKGLSLFRINCASCHTEPLFTNYSYKNNGIDNVFTDLGRAKITLDPSDNGKFKVPTLRNIELTYPYMHDGRFWSLTQVIDHYNSGIKHSATLATQLQNPISFTSTEKQQLLKFLKTLTDYELLSDFNLSDH